MQHVKRTEVRNRKAVEGTAQAVLDARAKFHGSTPADLYDPNTMPPALLAAHKALDRAVDACYGRRKFATEMERVQYLFEMYQRLATAQKNDAPKKLHRKGKLIRKAGVDE